MFALVACGDNHTVVVSDAAEADGALTDGGALTDTPAAPNRTVFVVTMENKPPNAIYGNDFYAPYINELMATTAAYATSFEDVLPALPSEPHYIWMEAGTNVFPEHTFAGNRDPDAVNSTASTAHLVNQLEAAGIAWMSYQEDMTAGTCPIVMEGFYVPKHNPFVFFQDVSGSPPVATSARCIEHHAPYHELAADLAAGRVSGYVFVTPNLCNDMHGHTSCPNGASGSGSSIVGGDKWLANELPQMIDYAASHDGYVFVVWDEGNETNRMPFLAIGRGVKIGPHTMPLDHSSFLKSIERLFDVPILPTVADAIDFTELFEPGAFP